MNKLTIFLLVVVLYTGCGSRPTPENTGIKSVFLENKQIEKLYEVEKDLSTGYVSQVFIYLADKSQLEQVNNYLIEKYKGKYSQTLQIWYFDKKGFAETYLASIDNKAVSDKKFNEMDKHLIATYEELIGQKGELEYNQ